MERITGLPVCRQFDEILVCIDRATCMGHFIDASKNDTAEVTARRLFDNVLKYHGLPAQIVSDRDVRFVNDFWIALMAQLKINLLITKMDQYFTNSAKEVLQNAATFALAVGTTYIDTEHLLEGLTKSTVASRVFEKLGLSSANISQQVESTIYKRPGISGVTSAEFTPRAKQSLNLAFTEAQNLGHTYMGAEHILLGLIREGEGLAFQLLSRNGITFEKAKKAVVEVVGQGDISDEKSITPNLDKFSRDLTKLAREGKVDPVIGRVNEITRVIQTLSRRRKNNPVLIGEPGVGKTAIAEGLALRIVNGNVPEVLQNKRVMALGISTKPPSVAI